MLVRIIERKVDLLMFPKMKLISNQLASLVMLIEQVSIVDLSQGNYQTDMAGKVRTVNANCQGLKIFGQSYYILDHNYQGTEQAQRVG